MQSIILLLLSILTIFAVPSHADQLDDLLKGIASDSVEARVEARQLLPRYGAKAAPRLIALIADEREVVWRAAYGVLADISNQVTVPGREADRLIVTNALMTLLAPEQSGHEKQQGLRLIPQVLPEEYPVSAITALMNEGGLIRERARVALEEARTLPASLALLNALENTDEDFQYALLNSLALLSHSTRISSQIPVASSVVPYAKGASPKVRAGAARVLAASGDPRYISILKEIRSTANNDTAFESGDALLLLADAMILKGGNFDAALDLYVYVLEAEKNPVLRGGALAGLGRYGDERAVGIIVAALKGEGGKDIEAPALNALQMCNAYNSVKEVHKVYPSLTNAQQLVLLGGFGRSGNPLHLPLLGEAAKNGTAEFQATAANALAEMQHPAAVDGLVALAESGEGDTPQRARKSLTQLANTFSASGDNVAAGKAWLGLYRTAQNEEEKAAALDGVKRHPTPEAYDVLVQTMSEEELNALPDGTLGAIAETLWNADRKAEAQETFEKILGRIKTTPGLEQAVYLASLMGQADKLYNTIGIVRNFYGVGPFKWDMATGFNKQTPLDPASINLDAGYTVEGEELKWKLLQTGDILGLVDLMGPFNQAVQSCVFAYSEIEVPEATDAQVRVGSDDGIKVWINGEAIHENNTDRGTALDQDIAPCTLVAGKNAILLQVTQGAGGWNFRFRLTEPDGTPILFKELFPKQ